MSRTNSRNDNDSASVDKLWSKIPHYPLGDVSDELPDKNPLLYRRIVAKRAIIAAYEESENPAQCINDLLADLRHLCDALRLDFADCDRAAYRNYARERVIAMHSGDSPR